MRRYSYRFKDIAGLIIALFLILFLFACDWESSSEEEDDTDVVQETGTLYGYASGPFSDSDSPTDLAIDGLGFFIVNDPEDISAVYYTRKGDFSVNQSTGVFASSIGHVVRGWELSRNPDSGEIKRIGSINDIVLTPIAQGGVDLSSVTVDEDGIIEALDDSDTLLPLYQIALATFLDYNGLNELGYDLFEKTGTSGDAITSIPGYYGFGEIRPFSREEDESDRFDNLVVSVDGSGFIIVLGSSSPWTSYYTDADELKFNKNGYLVISSGYIAQGWSLIKDDVGETTVDGPMGDIQLESFTIYSEEYGAGDLILSEIGQDGIITNSYSNGQAISPFQIALADFANPSVLEETASGLFAETSGSGEPGIGKPNEGELGVLTFD